MADETQSTDQKTVAGASGGIGPNDSPIGDRAGDADSPNQVQPNDAIRLTPKPDAEGLAPIPTQSASDTTGSEAPRQSDT